MRNLNKKYLIIGIIIICIIIYIFNNYTKESKVENIYIENTEPIQEEKKSIIVIHITGEVLKPGIIEIEEGARINDAINKAGGLTENADINKINLAYMLTDGQKVYIPSIYDEENITYIIEEDLKSNKKININTGSKEELEELTGIGPSLAEIIIKYRKEKGKFTKIEDIKNVTGIGESKYNAIKDFICIK